MSPEHLRHVTLSTDVHVACVVEVAGQKELAFVWLINHLMNYAQSQCTYAWWLSQV